MQGPFFTAKEIERESLDWGSLAWFSRPSSTGAQKLVVVEVTLSPGGSHNFHKHPVQEEVIYVIEGTIEQWVDRQKKSLGPGDSAFIPADAVHASFNDSNSSAKLLAILGPCVGDGGYELVEVADQHPWNTLR